MNCSLYFKSQKKIGKKFLFFEIFILVMLIYACAGQILDGISHGSLTRQGLAPDLRQTLTDYCQGLMGKLINQAVLDEIQSLYPLLRIRPFTQQQETLMMLMMEGSTVAAASRAAGYSTSQAAKNFLASQPALAVQEYFAKQQMEKISITRDMLTKMALECYGERGTATEGLKAVEVLARLHGQNEEAKQKKADTNVTINQQNNTTINADTDPKVLKKKMAAMDDAQLLEYVGGAMAGLDLEPRALAEVVVEGELIESTPDADTQDC